MVNTDLILTFENTTEVPLVIVIDPPCEDFELKTGQTLKLKIINYRGNEDQVSDILGVRYSEQNTISIDIKYNFTLVVVIDDKEHVIWEL